MLLKRYALRPAYLLLLFALCTASVPPPAVLDFVLVNRTGVTIDKLFVSPHDADKWGEDVLGRDVLPDGESVKISFSRSEASHVWDIRVVDGEGTALDWEQGFDLSTIEKITLKYDHTSGQGTAEFE